jgi:drug/metabolite transporter (DMT)-like permease
MWLILALGSAIIDSAQWSVIRASHEKIPSSLMTAAHHILGPFLATGIFIYPMPVSETIVWIYLGYVFFVNPPFSWLSVYSTQRIPVSLSKPLGSFSTISSTLAGVFLFQTNFPPLGLWAIILGFIGLWMLYHARWSEWKKPYPWILTGCMLNFGMVSVLTSQVLEVYPHPIIVSGIGLTGALTVALTGSIAHYRKWNLHRQTIVMLLFIAISNIISQIIGVMALGMAPAAYVVSIKRTSIILTALIGYAIFRERQTPFWRLMLATGIVTLSIVLMAIQ